MKFAFKCNTRNPSFGTSTILRYAIWFLVRARVADLPKHERDAIWLQTDAGGDWDCEEPEDRKAYPVVDDDIVEYIVRDYVYSQAGRWSNGRIRGYIDQSSMRD
jgi:hypothetical protein